MNKLDFLKDWTRLKRFELNDVVDTKILNHNDLVYYQGDKAPLNNGSFNIIKSGYIKMCTNFQIETVNRIPVAGHKWEYTKTIKTVRYVLAILEEGDFLGHEELDLRVPYKCDSICIGRTEILYINREKFDQFFDRREIRKLYKYIPKIEPQKILEAIQARDILMRRNINAVRDATKLNFVKGSSRIISESDQKYAKIKPWLKKKIGNTNSKKPVSSDAELNELCKRIKVLSVLHKTVEIKSDVDIKAEYPKITICS